MDVKKTIIAIYLLVSFFLYDVCSLLLYKGATIFIKSNWNGLLMPFCNFLFVSIVLLALFLLVNVNFKDEKVVENYELDRINRDLND